MTDPLGLSVECKGVQMQRELNSPLVTFALIAFNQEHYIREAVLAAFAQTYSPLEIIISDDCSADDTCKIIDELIKRYRGPHKVSWNRNPINLGIGSHVNRIFELARGELIVLAAGDDISAPERTAEVVSTWLKAGRPDGSIHSAAEIISPHGKLIGRITSDRKTGSVTELVRKDARLVIGPCHALTRGIHSRFGPLPKGTVFEDRALSFRSFLSGKILYIKKPLVKYRQHQNSISSQNIFTDPSRWQKWLNGLELQYQSYLADYQKATPVEKREKKVIKEINAGLLRVRRSAKLCSGSKLERACAAWRYSAPWAISARVAFLLQISGLRGSLAYQLLSFGWRTWHRLHQKKRRNPAANAGTGPDGSV